MKRNFFYIIAAALIVFSLIAYLFGRAYQRSESARDFMLISPIPATTPHVSADFGSAVYRNLATISFVDLYETLRETSPRQRVAWLAQIEQTSESSRKTSALCGFLRALVQIDPVAAGDLVVQLKRHRSPAMDAVISAAPPAAMPQLADMLLKLPKEVRTFQLTDHLAMVIDEWLQVDPDAAMRFVEEHRDAFDEPFDDSFLKTWAGIDADAARNWMETHPENVTSGAIRSWLTGWFSAEPEAAIDYGLAHLDDERFRHSVTTLASEVFPQSETKAKQFVDQLPNAEMRKEALSAIASEASSPDYSDDFSPAVVTKFIVQFPPAEWPSELSSVLLRWRYAATNELLDWVAELSPELQSKVIDSFPSPISGEEEQDLLPVLQLPASTLRTQLLRQLVAGMKSETGSATETIEKLNLSAEQKAELARFLSENEKQ